MTSPYKCSWNVETCEESYSHENAKKCYCPIIKANCKGRTCMMWRDNIKIKSEKKGYCGLAGKYEYIYGDKDYS